MSECVVRMEMPGSCLECPFFNKVGCKASGMMFPDWLNVAVRPKGCPIIAVLPEKHGNLVDADTDASKYITVLDCNCSEYGKQTVMAVDDLNYLPTIVPATEGGKE